VQTGWQSLHNGNRVMQNIAVGSAQIPELLRMRSFSQQ